jgi:hypothetical protein
MGQTNFTGPILSGDLQQGETNGPNQGFVRLAQSVQLTQNSTTAVSKTMYIPAGSQIVNFDIDVLTAFNSGTSATLSIGTTAGATTYVGSVDVKSATGRIAPTYTAAQLAAMSNQTVTGTAAPTTAPVVVTITPVGATSAGYVNVTMSYIQLTSSN